MVLRKIVEYDISLFPFRTLIEDLLGEKDLELIHERYNIPLVVRENDQKTDYHKIFYKNCDLNNSFDELYKKFVKEYVSPMFEDDNIVYQKRPTFRIHLNNNKAVGEFHRDSDYNHPLEEINIFIPMTESRDANTIWVEKFIDSEDFEPINLKYGQAFVFNGGLLTHGNKVNTTNQTRVSFDFRVIRSNDYKNGFHSSINSNQKFEIGSYYERL